MNIETLKTELRNYLLPLQLDEKVQSINELRQLIHDESPFKNEPVDFVRWVKSDRITANEYNPNKVAPPEMELLEVSIFNDGYTQPIVGWDKGEDGFEVVDGFHRNRVGKESKVINKRINGYLPIVNIRNEQSGKNDRIASTIRHNRARGKHQVDAMSEIVIELKNRNWTNQRIAKQLGMDEEEVLRLCQISGLEHLFTDQDFSQAWESSDYVENTYEILTDDDNCLDMDIIRIPNEKDDSRVFHTFEKWECHKVGFYAPSKEGFTAEQAKTAYADFLKNSDLFARVLAKVTTEWVYSCEHYLTNRSMNRIAWLGQASACYHLGLPSVYCGGFNLLSEEEQLTANNVALTALNEWLFFRGKPPVDLGEAMNSNKQTELY